MHYDSLMFALQICTVCYIYIPCNCPCLQYDAGSSDKYWFISVLLTQHKCTWE